jgi:hypothetical protein
VYDYHPQRVRYARSVQYTVPNDVPNVPELGTAMDHPSSWERQEPAASGGFSYLLHGDETALPCLVKEIPIPDGSLVGSLMCVLDEDAVALVEASEQ